MSDRNYDRDRRGDRRDDRRPETPATLVVRPEEVGLPDKPFDDQSDVERVRSVLMESRRTVNVIGPITQIDRIPGGYVLSLRLVQFPLDGLLDRDGRIKSGRFLSNGLWHKVPGGQDNPDRLALQKTALDQIAAAAGVEYLPPRRMDDGSEVHLWRYQCGIRFRGFDGQWREVWDEVENDLRGQGQDLSPQAGTEGNNLRNARKFGARVCISKAFNRAIRRAFGLRPLVVEDARKPFLYPLLQYVPDMENSTVAAMVAAKELGIVNDVFGPGSALGSKARGETVIVDAVPERTDDHRLLPDPDADPSSWGNEPPREREPVRRERDRSPPRARERERTPAHPDDRREPWDREGSRRRDDDYDRGRGRDDRRDRR